MGESSNSGKRVTERVPPEKSGNPPEKWVPPFRFFAFWAHVTGFDCHSGR